MKLISEWSLNKSTLPQKVILGCFLTLLLVLTAFLGTVLPIVNIGLIPLTLIWLGIAVAITIIHEALHGLFFWIYSRHVKFGLKWSKWIGLTAYATSPNVKFTRTRFQIIALAPQILTAVLVLASFMPVGTTISRFLFISGIANFAGGCVDIFCTAVLARYPKEVLIEDTKDGYRIWTNPNFLDMTEKTDN